MKTEKITDQKNNITELVFLLDRSGSMSGLEADTIGGFNAMLEKQKKEQGKALVSTVLFDHERQVLHDRLDISRIEPMNADDYFVRGCTALLDAVGFAVHHIGNVHKYARREDIPSKTMFVIVTDGLENASRFYDAQTVKKMIERQKSRYGWEFIFIGANIDAVASASHIGIAPEFAANYRSDSAGTEALFENISNAVSNVRCDVPLGSEWRVNLNEDAKRK